MQLGRATAPCTVHGASHRSSKPAARACALHGARLHCILCTSLQAACVCELTNGHGPMTLVSADQHMQQMLEPGPANGKQEAPAVVQQ